MKYLKKFNESSNEYYLSVDYNEWINAVYSKSVRFEERYIDEIKNRLKTEYKKIRPGGNYIEIVYDKLSNELPPHSYEIGQCQDEWFYVKKDEEQQMDDFIYYKCDQFEGLLKFLEDNNVIE